MKNEYNMGYNAAMRAIKNILGIKDKSVSVPSKNNGGSWIDGYFYAIDSFCMRSTLSNIEAMRIRNQKKIVWDLVIGKGNGWMC